MIGIYINRQTAAKPVQLSGALSGLIDDHHRSHVCTCNSTTRSSSQSANMASRHLRRLQKSTDLALAEDTSEDEESSPAKQPKHNPFSYLEEVMMIACKLGHFPSTKSIHLPIRHIISVLLQPDHFSGGKRGNRGGKKWRAELIRPR